MAASVCVLCFGGTMVTRVDGERLRILYEGEKARVRAVPEYLQDMDWVDRRWWSDFRNQGPGMFLLEHAYVVLCSGFKNSVVEGFWKDYVRAWRGWDNWDTISIRPVIEDCNAIFRNTAKNEAIGKACVLMRLTGWKGVVESIEEKHEDALTVWPWIGPITKYHLGRNIGLDVVKPDRHLVRWAEHLGYETPLDLCKAIQELSGERLGTIDLVLWRSAEAFGPPGR